MTKAVEITDTKNQMFGHPKGLFYLFFAEMWERFSFYGMRALLIMYMTQELLYSDVKSFGVYAAYGSILYATPLIGGMLADKIMGYRNAILMGGLLMTVGHFTMSIETPVFFYGSLALIMIGNGFFKPNISSMVGALYENQNDKRESGFTIFYLGINLGSTIAPLLCAWLGIEYGWHYGFGAAGVGMLLGLITFYRGTISGVFGAIGIAPISSKLEIKSVKLNYNLVIGTLSFASIPLFASLIYYNEYEHYLVWLVTITVTILMVNIMRKVTKSERQRLYVVSYFIGLTTVFWAIYEQAGSSLTLFASRNVNLILINAPQTNSLNAGFIMLLAIPFSLLWKFLNDRNKNFSSAIKFGIGLILLGVGYLVFAYSATQADSNAHVPMLFLIIGTLVYTIGELFLSPVGLSKASELSPAKYAAFIMGMWFLSSFYGHFIAGKIAKLTASTSEISGFGNAALDGVIQSITGLSPSSATELGNGFSQLFQYVSAYGLFGITAILVGIFAILVSPIVKRGMNGVL